MSRGSAAPGENQPLCAHSGQAARPSLGQLAQSSWPYEKPVSKGSPRWEWRVLALPAALWPAAFLKTAGLGDCETAEKPCQELTPGRGREAAGSHRQPGYWGILGPASSVGPRPSACWARGQGDL